MKKITKPHEPEEDQYIFTEGIDYSKTEKNSIWGTGDKDTLELLKDIEINGKWLNLAAGDGRYNLNLLEKAYFVVASDIDESALSKLWQKTPDKLKTKLQTKVFDITKKFPFENNSFNGVFCTGTLHLFPKEILRQIFSEIDRILKPNGRILIDFATDIKRILPDGKLYIRKSEPQYKNEEATKFLTELLNNYKVQIVESEVPEEEIKTRGFVYRFSCKFILLTADKK
ncbi:TPA: class I SAM-dependent methyltransferase [Candidatus Woesearchaeota archaeon]|nr:class I SAM-dependent methyltransferase [Candidatus Woesearchaeota archaeon]HIG93358.1 class I SAM-dependent methyltransferase [Candidatus Woesearchaeota archaeon]